MGNTATPSLGHPHRWEPLPLFAHPELHAEEIARFTSRVVQGPAPNDCAIYVGALGNDGYPIFRICRDGKVRVVRATRYALAIELGRQGQALTGDVRALHECDNPPCVRVVTATQIASGVHPHVVGGNQQENMARMARMGRGGGRPLIVSRGAGRMQRAQRSRAIREAVRHGWDTTALTTALLSDDQPTLW